MNTPRRLSLAIPVAVLALLGACTDNNRPSATAAPASPTAATATATAAAPPAPDAGERCDPSKKPTLPVSDASTPTTCAQAGGTWVGPPGGLPPGTKLECNQVGRGRTECHGCTALPTTDGGKPCTYDWECQSECSEKAGGGTCTSHVNSHVGGCRPRCIEGRVQVLCVD